MSDDLVKQLRKGPLRDDYETAITMSESADRIEQLEAALRTIYDCCDETGNCSVVRRIARKALEGKDER